MVHNKLVSKSKKQVSKSKKQVSKSKKPVSKSTKFNKTCPNLPQRKATGWSKIKVDGKDMLVKTCCRGCAVAIEKKLKDGKMKNTKLVLLPFSDAKMLVAKGENVRDVKVGGVCGACGDRSSKKTIKKKNAKKCDGCGCKNKRRTHKAHKGGSVRAGTVVQNMPVRQKGGAVRAGTVVQNMPLKH